MKPDNWKRLAGEARQAPAEPPAEMPFGFDTRAIAGWRAQRGDGETVPWTLLLRGALVCSALIMALSVAMNYRSLQEREPGADAIADSAIQMSMLP
jgi:hypothetical protein